MATGVDGKISLWEGIKTTADRGLVGGSTTIRFAGTPLIPDHHWLITGDWSLDFYRFPSFPGLSTFHPASCR
ncbi:hypothetical protein HYR99_03620 [Candidatus Poribacteria bacterium]|nr:hypothetical protein [Candidatus Poribacteria bacterium]